MLAPLLRHIRLPRCPPAAPKVLLARPFVTTSARASRPNKQKAEKQNRKEKVKDGEPEAKSIHQGKPLATTIRSVLVPLQDAILFNHASKVNNNSHQKGTKNPSENSRTPPASNQIKNLGKALRLPEPEANRLPRWVEKLTPARNEAAHTCSGDEIMSTWDYRDNYGKQFVKALFPKVFGGVQLKDWKAKATEEQKRMRISSSAEWEKGKKKEKGGGEGRG